MNSSVLLGSLVLGQDNLWKGENIIKDLCLYSDDCDPSSEIVEVNLKLEAVVETEYCRLFNLEHTRWKVAEANPEVDLQEFFGNVFHEGFNPSGSTKKSLLVEMLNEKRTDTSPFNRPVALVIYGEKTNDSSTADIYAHPMLHDLDHFPIYQMAKFDDNCSLEEEADALVEIFDLNDEYEYLDGIPSSADLLPPPNKIKEIDLFEMAHERTIEHKRDLISEAKLASKMAKERLLLKRQNSLLQQQQFHSLFYPDLAPPSAKAKSEHKNAVVDNKSSASSSNNKNSLKLLPTKQKSEQKAAQKASRSPYSRTASPSAKTHYTKAASTSAAPLLIPPLSTVSTSAVPTSAAPLLIAPLPVGPPPQAATNTHSPSATSQKKNTTVDQETYEERKKIVRRAIRDEMVKNGKTVTEENEQFFQHVYSSFRYNYLRILKSANHVDLDWLKLVIKMHVDFFLQMESIVNNICA
ncbi:MAG: hypothetical protein EXX96DRAFT_577293 [Benjaminiella poitrasii]|nr:MAG: hypothetical protein EXX96DRAFT_577293 [Benjaminiella poitrasii]